MRKAVDRNPTYGARGGPSAALSRASSMAAEARQAERVRIARELHDSVVQPLASLLMSFTCLESSASSSETIDANLPIWKGLAQEALDALRVSLLDMNLHPHARLGLPEALRRHVIPHLQLQGLRVSFDCQAWPTDVPLEWTSHLYLVVREALLNVEKYARASTVSISLSASPVYLKVEVADDGIGFQPRHVRRTGSASGTGLGIVGMRERVRGLGGQLRLVSAPGEGVRLNVRLRRADTLVAIPSQRADDLRRAARRRHAPRTTSSAVSF